jgi:hypothetical protein
MGGLRVEIVLEAQRSEVPPWARVKGLLKAALRTWGLRCLSVRDVTPRPSPTASPVATGGGKTARGPGPGSGCGHPPAGGSP